MLSGCTHEKPILPVANPVAPIIDEAQNPSEPVSTGDNTSGQYENFVPSGWEILATEENDFNNDGLMDAVLVIQKIQERADYDDSEGPSRELLIIYRDEFKGLTLTIANDRAIICRTCGGLLGDPFVGIASDGNSLALTHYGGSRERWGYVHTFTLQKNGDWLLTKETITTEDTFLLTSKEETVDFTTGEYSVRYTVPPDYRNNPDFDDSAKREIADLWDRPEEKRTKSTRPLIILDYFNIDDQIGKQD